MRPPTKAELWGERAQRRVTALDRGRHVRYQASMHELLGIHRELHSDVVLEQGRWVDNPHQGDREWARAEELRVWAEVGALLGIGPPPERFLR